MPAGCDGTPCCHMSWRAHADAHSCVTCVLLFVSMGYLTVGDRTVVAAVLIFALLGELLFGVALFVAFCASSPAPSIATLVAVEPTVQVV